MQIKDLKVRYIYMAYVSLQAMIHHQHFKTLCFLKLSIYTQSMIYNFNFPLGPKFVTYIVKYWPQFKGHNVTSRLPPSQQYKDIWNYLERRVREDHRIQIEWTSLSKKMQGLAWELFLYCVNWIKQNWDWSNLDRTVS